MRRYHSRMSLATAAAAPEATDQPTPVARQHERPIHYRVEHSTFKKKPPVQLPGVDAEYSRYISSGLTNSDVDILWFWEVRLFSSNSTLTHLLNRPIRLCSRLYLRSLWTTYQFKQHLFLANGCFLRRRRRIRLNETGSAPCSWRLFNY